MTSNNRLFSKQVLALLLFSLLSACTAMDLVTPADAPDEKANWSAADFYNKAHASLEDESYLTAIELYELLETRYPFGQYAEQAQIELAYAYYKSDEPDSALATAGRFIRIHPRHQNIDYVYYLTGLINFHRDLGFLERYLPSDRTQRDPGAALESLADFETLLRRFPNSKYAADSRQRIIALKSNLAYYELNVAAYYAKRGAYVAAINRAQYIIEEYPKTTAVPRALLVMLNIYKKTGMNDLASDTQQIFSLNYPNGLPPVNNPNIGTEPTVSESIWEYLELDK